MKINPIYILLGVVAMLLLSGLALFYAKYLWYLGMLLSPLVLGLSAYINPRPLVDYTKMLGDTFWRNPLKGIAYSALTFFGLPFVAVYLLFKAIFVNKLTELQKQGFGDKAQMFGNASQIFDAETLFGNNRHAQQNAANDGDFSDYEEIETTIK